MVDGADVRVDLQLREVGALQDVAQLSVLMIALGIATQAFADSQGAAVRATTPARMAAARKSS